jgi:hypothetical protein
MNISEALKSQIRAQKGILSLREAAKRFGVSARTVGRCYHGADRSPAATDILALQEEVKSLTRTVESLLRTVAALQPQQRIRKELNPDLQSPSKQSSCNDYSSQYRDREGMELVTVFGIDVPLSYDWRDKASSAVFKAEHPASPACETYPYPHAKRMLRPGEAAPAYRDPVAGKYCECESCQKWRLGLAREYALLKRMPHAVFDRAMWKARILS